MGDANSFPGQSSYDCSISPYVRRRPVDPEQTSDDSSVSDDSPVPRHRTQNRVRYNLEERETTSKHIPSSNEASVEQNDLMSFISFGKEHHCDKIYIDDKNCGICFELYDENYHHPFLLPCGHVLCLTCITALAKKEDFNCVVCPNDRLKHEIKDFQLKTTLSGATMKGN